MKKRILLFTIAALLFSCQSSQKSSNETKMAAAQDKLQINWSYEVAYPHEWDPTLPISDISVKINNTKYTVVTGAQGEFYELEEKEYAAWHIPESALSASIGGWGGLIRCLYVERQKAELHIIQGFSDAESGVEGLIDIERLKTVRLSE